MKVSAAVQELERQYEAMRARAEQAEGLIRVYEARDKAQEVSKAAVSDGDWVTHWRNGDEDPIEFTYSPGLWLLGLTEIFLKDPRPFELRVSRADKRPTRETP